MAKLCAWTVRVFAVLYLLALALLLVGTLGLFGQAKDPLAGVFLIPLGLPWILLLEGFPEALRPWLGALTPLLNIVILAGICRVLTRKKRA